MVMMLLGFGRSNIDVLRPQLYRIAYAWCHNAALAEDLTQDALSKAWLSRTQLREKKALKGWLITILNHCWLDHLRARRDCDDIDALSELIETDADGPEVVCGRNQIVVCVREAVSRLPLGQRQVLTLVDLEECSYLEVAEVLGIPVGTVMSRLSRARNALKDILNRAMLNQAAPNQTARRLWSVK